MTTTIRNRLVLLLILTVTVVGIVLTAVPSTALAEESGVAFDSTDVLDDLTSSTVNGEKFDLKNYPFDEEKQIQVLSFVEYCYSYRANQRGNYGLYIYVYNPQGLNLDTGNKGNKIQMAVKYDNEGKPADYAKLPLVFCGKSEQADYKNLFYKFKVQDVAIDGKTFADRVNSNERRYDVSGIELVTYGEKNAKEYAVNATYKFTGYAAGYGPDGNSKSTLMCDAGGLETITLDVQHTFYRTKTSGKGAGYQNQIDTVYFTVPQKYFDIYGTLQRIKAEWYEYKTKDIIVTSNEDFFNAVQANIGVDIGAYGDEDIGYGAGENVTTGNLTPTADWAWNLGNWICANKEGTLFYIFKTDNIEEYDPYADVTEIGGVTSNALYEYIENYDKTFSGGTLPIKDGTISADLFEDDIDDHRKMNTEFGKIQQGYSYYDFDADVDLQKLTSWQDSDPSFWDNWKAWGLWDTIFGNIPQEESRTISPIYIVQDADLQGSDEEISERLLVNYHDVSEIKECYNKAKAANEQMVLFRFATSDYYSSAVDIVEYRGILKDKLIEGEAYRAQESVFFDFDIIQLTFHKDGVYTVIPVVSSPIDIVNAITPPVQLPSDWEWWQILIAVALFILLIVILFPILPYVVRLVLWIVLLPFRLIAAIFKAIGNAVKKKE